MEPVHRGIQILIIDNIFMNEVMMIKRYIYIEKNFGLAERGESGGMGEECSCKYTD